MSKHNISKTDLCYRFNAIPVKIPAASLYKIDKLILKFILKCKGTQNRKNNFERKGFTFPYFKTTKNNIRNKRYHRNTKGHKRLQ